MKDRITHVIHNKRCSQRKLKDYSPVEAWKDAVVLMTALKDMIKQKSNYLHFRN